MKKNRFLSLMLALVMLFGLVSALGGSAMAADVAIDSTNFPDAYFREFVKQYDTNNNGVLNTEELAAVKVMDCSNKNIADLKGIEHFTALNDLRCYKNQLKSLDVSRNTALEMLICFGNQLASLDVSAVPAIRDAVVNGTKDGSNPGYDFYQSGQHELHVDKTVTVTVTAGSPSYPKGDVDRSGQVGNSDLIMVARHVVHILTLTGEQFTLGDMNDDNVIDNKDIITLAKKIVGM